MLVEVYGDAAVTRKTVYKWSEWFRSGSESIDDEERLGRPSTSCTDENMISELFQEVAGTLEQGDYFEGD
jgi:hypothetical protein